MRSPFDWIGRLRLRSWARSHPALSWRPILLQDLLPLPSSSQPTGIEKGSGLAGRQACCILPLSLRHRMHQCSRAATVEDHPNGLKVVCSRTAGSRHGSNKRGTPGWGSPYASEPLSSLSGCRQGSSNKLARYQTKYGQRNVQFRRAFACVRLDDPARATQPKARSCTVLGFVNRKAVSNHSLLRSDCGSAPVDASTHLLRVNTWKCPDEGFGKRLGHGQSGLIRLSSSSGRFSHCDYRSTQTACDHAAKHIPCPSPDHSAVATRVTDGLGLPATCTLGQLEM